MVWDPFEEMRRMHEEMDRMFGRVFGSAGQKMLPGGKSGPGQLATSGFRMPAADVYETESNVIATFEVPGASKDNIDLNVTEDSIEVTVKQTSEEEQGKKEEGEYRYSASSSSFHRRMPLPASVDPEKAQATYKDGVLNVEMPKIEPKHGGKRVPVK